MQKGGSQNDTVLVPFGGDAARASIRIRQWTPIGEAKGAPLLFVRHYIGTFVSGTCEPVR